MCYFGVIATVSPLALVLGLVLGSMTPALAELAQWTEAAGVISESDGHGPAPSPNPRQEPPALDASLTVLSEQTMHAERLRQVEQGGSGFATKLAFDLGLTRQREENAPSALDHVGITPVGGWIRRSECTPEVFYDVLAAARRAAIAGRLSVSADGAEAIVRAAFTSCLTTGQEAASEQLPVVTAEDYHHVASEEPVLVYEQASVWPQAWLSPLLAGPVVAIGHRPSGAPLWRPSHVFVQHPPWRCRSGFPPGGFPAVQRQILSGPWVAPPVRVVRATPQFFASPVSRLPVASGHLPMSVRHIGGGFFRR
jgi:hypothetical protein